MCHIPEPEEKDEAEDKPGESSSNGGKGDPDDVTDPEEKPEKDDSNCFVSEDEKFPWLAVDLGKKTKIGRVRIRTATNNGMFVTVNIFICFCLNYLYIIANSEKLHYHNFT